MARKDEAADLLRQGLPPSAIARQMGTSTPAVMQYLCLKIGEGDLRRSDITFAIPHDVRVAIEEIVAGNAETSAWAIARELKKRGIQANRLDIGVYLHYKRTRVVLGDMYELVRSVEVRLHSFVKQAFIAEFGEENWWRSGVPDNIRAECAALLEKDPEPADEPYCYTHLINLREILEKRWSVFLKYLPERLQSKKKELLERIVRLNRIRNGVMHPVRNSPLTEDDFEFVRDFERELSDLKVELPAVAEPAPTLTEALEEAAAPAPASPQHELVTALTPTVEDPPEPEETMKIEEAS